MSAPLPHSGLESRIMGWRSLVIEYQKNVTLARRIHDRAPNAKRREFLVRAMSALETAKAHLDALTSQRALLPKCAGDRTC